MTASTDAEAGFFSSKTRLPRTFLKWPRTYVTIMCRAQNSAAVCPGSKNHLAIGAPFLAALTHHRYHPALPPDQGRARSFKYQPQIGSRELLVATAADRAPCRGRGSSHVHPVQVVCGAQADEVRRVVGATMRPIHDVVLD